MTPLTTAAAATRTVRVIRSPPGSQLERNRAFWHMISASFMQVSDGQLYRQNRRRLASVTRSSATPPRRASSVSTVERHHRVRDHLERPRRKRGERRSELRAPTGRSIGMPTPLASEHHGDDHLEPLQAIAAASMAAVATVLRVRAVG